MSMQNTIARETGPVDGPLRAAGAGDVLAVSFGATVCLWLAAYVGLSPLVNAPQGLVGAVTALGLAAAGWVLGRHTDRGARGGLLLGGVIGVVNFIIVASLHRQQHPGEALMAGLLWCGGFMATSVLLCGLGAAIASRGIKGGVGGGWTCRFAVIVAATLLPLLVSGGIVTGLEAGLAVPDWLTTFDFPMMFYPLEKMREDANIYAEHFHRLWGLLVGLSLIALVGHLWVVERRAWVKWLAAALLGAVIVQGVLGGTRVTEQHIALAIAHGVFAQVVFAGMVLLAAFVSSRWQNADPPAMHEKAATDRKASLHMVSAVLLQLLLGAMYRHLNAMDGVSTGLSHGLLGLHVIMAVVVTGGVIFVGGRAWGIYRSVPVLPQLGGGLMLLTGAQLVLGIAALVAVLVRGREPEIPLLEVVLTTAHQITGALILAAAVLLAAWTRRLLGSSPAAATNPAQRT